MTLAPGAQGEVVTSECGTVLAVDVRHGDMVATMDDGRLQRFAAEDLDAAHLGHGYAVTVHRSQGSEYPCVVIPLTTSAWMMLQRNLLYTAITRAKKLVVLVGSKKALGQAVRTVGAGRRHTTLDYRLSHQ